MEGNGKPTTQRDSAVGFPSRISSLDSSGRKLPLRIPWVSDWSRRQKRFYQRTMSGIEFHRVRGHSLKFLTLTSAPASSPDRIHRAFSCLVKRIRRIFGSFEYICTRELTKSGLVHLHLIFSGAWIHQHWVSRIWNELHGAPIVFIEKVRGGSSRLGRYLVKYLGKEHDSNGRFWWSWGWVYRGFVKDWNFIKSRYSKPLEFWHRLLHDHVSGRTSSQVELTDGLWFRLVPKAF